MRVCVLLARQRSGTGALGTILDRHANIKYIGEVFHPDQIGTPVSYFSWYLESVKQNNDRCMPAAGEKLFEDYIKYLGSIHSEQIIVIDIKYRSTHHFNGYWHGPLETPMLFRLCDRHEVPIIHLTRRNFLKTHVSGILAEKNRIWHMRPNDELVAKTLQVDISKMLNALRSSDREENNMAAFVRKNTKVLRVDYEELFDADGQMKETVATGISDLLKISEFQDRKPVFLKQTSDNLSEVIENFAEVAGALRGTPFQWMLGAEPEAKRADPAED